MQSVAISAALELAALPYGTTSDSQAGKSQTQKSLVELSSEQSYYNVTKLFKYLGRKVRD